MTLLLAALLMVQNPSAATPTMGSITGRVLLPDGAPVAGRRVMAIEEAAPKGTGDKPAVVRIMGLAETDASGMYALTDIPPGRYLIVEGSVTMPTYFPGSADRKQSSPVAVTAGGAVKGVDIILNEARIVPLLASNDPIDQAWAAWIAAESGRAEWTPMIEEKLKKVLADPLATERLIDTLSDALIRLNAKPPADLVRALFLHRPAEALILMSRSGAATSSDLLDLLVIAKDDSWIAIANQLLARRSPGFVVRLLIPLQLSAQLNVCDSESNCPKGVSGWVGRMPLSDDVSFEMLGSPRASGPPWPKYGLSMESSVPLSIRGTLLADGPMRVHYRRLVSMSRPSTSEFDVRDAPPSATILLTYLAAAAPGVTVDVQAYEERKTIYRDESQVKAEAESFRNDILRRYAALLDQLLRAGALTAAEAERVATPRLDFSIGGDAVRANR